MGETRGLEWEKNERTTEKKAKKEWSDKRKRDDDENVN